LACWQEPAITARFLEPTSLALRWLLVPLAVGGGVLAVLCVKWAGPSGEGRWQLDKLSESIGAAKAPDARRVHRLTKVSAASFAIAAATLLLFAIL
jgi:hypothetical protein